MKKNINFKQDIKRKLILFSILPLLILSSLLITKIYFLMEDSYKNHFKMTLSNINHRLDLFRKKILYRESVLKRDKNIDIKTFVMGDDNINFIALLDKGGKILKFASKTDFKGQERIIKTLFEKYEKGGKPSFLFAKIENRATMLYFCNKNGNIYMLDIDLKDIIEYINFLKKHEKFHIAIVDKSGEFIVSTSKNIDCHKNFFNSEIYKKAVKKHKEFEYFEFFNSKMGIDNFFMYAKNRDLHWLIFAIDESESLDDRVLIMIGWTILFLLAIIVIILFISDKLVKKILIPLESFISKMERFANSHTTQYLQIDSDYLFFKKLSESFNKMQNKILQREKELSDLNRTLERRVEEEVEKNRAKDRQMINQSRLAQMGQMINMIAHQWRQPLSAISAVSAKLKLKAQLNKLDSTSTIELCDKISSYSQQLSSTIDNFRKFFKSDGEKRETDYKEIIEEALEIVGASLKDKKIDITKELNSSPKIITHPDELKQAVLNILKNAEETLLKRGVDNPNITITSKNNTLKIEDNAGGVEAEIMDKIFDPYFSTKSRKDGVGLGLYISKIIVEERCKGKLQVKNSLKGAIFTIELP